MSGPDLADHRHPSTASAPAAKPKGSALTTSRLLLAIVLLAAGIRNFARLHLLATAATIAGEAAAGDLLAPPAAGAPGRILDPGAQAPWPSWRRGQRPPPIPQRSKYAYAFLVAGCDPTKPDSYRGMLLNVLVSSHLLRSVYNSTADVVLMVRPPAAALSQNGSGTAGTSKNTVGGDRGDGDGAATEGPLSPEERRWLERARVRLLILPPAVRDNFSTATLDKFRILDLVEYDRVVFMDSDAFPTCRLDYWFEESEPSGEGGEGGC